MKQSSLRSAPILTIVASLRFAPFETIVAVAPIAIVTSLRSAPFETIVTSLRSVPIGIVASLRLPLQWPSYLERPKITLFMLQQNHSFHPRRLIHLHHKPPRQNVLARSMGMHSNLFVPTPTLSIQFGIQPERGAPS
jgi:hypothetical protein